MKPSPSHDLQDVCIVSVNPPEHLALNYIRPFLDPIQRFDCDYVVKRLFLILIDIDYGKLLKPLRIVLEIRFPTKNEKELVLRDTAKHFPAHIFLNF